MISEYRKGQGGLRWLGGRDIIISNLRVTVVRSEPLADVAEKKAWLLKKLKTCKLWQMASLSNGLHFLFIYI